MMKAAFFAICVLTFNFAFAAPIKTKPDYANATRMPKTRFTCHTSDGRALNSDFQNEICVPGRRYLRSPGIRDPKNVSYGSFGTPKVSIRVK